MAVVDVTDVADLWLWRDTARVNSNITALSPRSGNVHLSRVSHVGGVVGGGVDSLGWSGAGGEPGWPMVSVAAPDASGGAAAGVGVTIASVGMEAAARASTMARSELTASAC